MLGDISPRIANLGPMLVGVIWHQWIGVVLLAVALLSVLGLAVGYLKNITAKQYPSRRQKQDG